MAIGTDATIAFWGTQDNLDSTSSAVSDGGISAATDLVQAWTNDDDAPYAAFHLKFQYPSGTIDGGGVHLYARLMNIDGTNDAIAPTTAQTHVYLGSFPTSTAMSATTDYYVPINGGYVTLPNMKSSQEYDFYIINECNVTLSAGWLIKVTPMTFGPKA